MPVARFAVKQVRILPGVPSKIPQRLLGYFITFNNVESCLFTAKVFFYCLDCLIIPLMKNNQKGFGVVEALVIIVILGFVGFGGWYIWQKGQKNESNQSNANVNDKDSGKGQTQKDSYKVPEGYTVYENKELGFTFAYPKEYGSFSSQGEVSGAQIIKSAVPKTQYGPGINGAFQIYTYATADQAITSRKYGPQIKLQNGKWIVTEANEADVIGNKVGDVYKDFEGNVPASQVNKGLAVYTLKSGDEGSEMDRLVFVAKGKLHEIYMPTFSDGLYGGDVANDKSAFSTLLTNVRDSVFSQN